VSDSLSAYARTNSKTGGKRAALDLTITRPELAGRLYREFDASEWKWFWSATPSEQFRTQLKRMLLA
jgi:hypothetical protein